MRMVNYKNKRVDSKITVFLILLSTTFMINIPVGFTNSGVFAIYGSDILSLVFLSYLLFDLVKNYRSYSKLEKRSIYLSLTFLIYVSIVLAIRAVNGFIDTKSLMIPRVVLTSVWFYILILRNIISVNALKEGFKYFIACISFISLILFFTTRPIAYQFMQSPAIRTSIQMFAYPVIMWSLIGDYKKTNRNTELFFMVYFTATIIIAGISSGSRINAVVIPLQIVVVSMAALSNRKVIVTKIFLGVLIGFLFSISVYPISFRYRIGSSRSPMFNAAETLVLKPLSKQMKFIDLFGEPRYGVPTDPSDDLDPDDLDKITDASKLDSSNSRFGVWKLSVADIKTAPIFGPGLKEYKVEYSTGSSHIMFSHNFILEYTLGFGIVGLLLFMISVFYPLFYLIKKLLRDFTDNIGYLLIVAVTLLAIGVNVLFQPLLLNPPVTLLIYGIVGMLVCYGLEENNH